MSKSNLQDIQSRLSSLHLYDALQFLSHLLAVSRDEQEDPDLQKEVASRTPKPLPFVVHFLAKQLLLNASPLGTGLLSSCDFFELQNMCIGLRDPIQDDPGWIDAEPTGALCRILAQQLPAQRRSHMLRLGIAVSLFGDREDSSNPVAERINQQLEHELGLPLFDFIRLGFLCGSLKRSFPNRYFTHMDFADAYHAGFEFCVHERWAPFLRRMAITRDEFRLFCTKIRAQTKTQYAQFEFNPLIKHPIIDVGDGRFVIVDRDLVLDRISIGVYFDLLDIHGTEFLINFGAVFESFVGALIRSAFQEDTIWSDSQWRLPEKADHAIPGQKADWAVSLPDLHVLVECKALRMPIPLTTYGDDKSVEDIRKKITKAARQLSVHAKNILSDGWNKQGLKSLPSIGIIVTFGLVEAVNLPFFKRRVIDNLIQEGIAPIPFVVLSIEEFDTLISHVENGGNFQELVYELTMSNSPPEVFGRFPLSKGSRCISRLTRAKSVTVR